MKLKNYIIACSCIIFAATCLSSCSYNPLEIIIYEAVNGPTKDNIKNKAKKFKDIVKTTYNEDIEISFLDFANLSEIDTRMQMNALNNYFPSLIVTNEEHEGRYNKLYSNNMVNLDSYLSDEEIGIDKEEIFNTYPIDDFVDEFLDSSRNYSTKGTYSLPLYKTNDVLYYAYDDLIGKEIDGQIIDEDYMNSLTFDKIIAISSNFKKENSKSIPLFVESEKNLILSLALENKIPLYDVVDSNLVLEFDNVQSKELITNLATYYKEGLLGSTLLAKEGASTYDPVDKFVAGDIKMFIAPLGYGDKLQDGNKNLKIGIAKSPYQSTLFNGSSISLWRSGLKEDTNEKLTRLSYQFMKYLTNPESLATFAMSAGTYIPSRVSSFEDKAFNYYVNADTLSSKALSYSLNNYEKLSYSSYKNTFGSKEVKDAIVGAFVQVALDKKDINKAIYDAYVSVINYI